MKLRRMTTKEEAAIDSLIGKATKAANQAVRGNDLLTDRQQDKTLWTHVYHDTMNKLAADIGLRIILQ